MSPAVAALLQPFPGCKGGTLEGCPSVLNTTLNWHEQLIDHFDWAAPLGNASRYTYRQRYFTHKEWWKPGGPIFFYFGNEDNVELYVNHTGLMWEAARPFGAALVFAEHRYYGASLPYEPGVNGCLSFLTTEQAMADFAELIYHVKDSWNAASSAVVGFGGSYGGMLGAWFRIKYPNAVDGVISASAPIYSFVGLDPPYDYDVFYQIATRDANATGGSAAACATNLKRALRRILEVGEADEAGKQLLHSSFSTCAAPRNYDEVYQIKSWAEGPWATMAMGNYPYASSYLLHGRAMLPPWPVRTACDALANDFADDGALFVATRRAVSVFYNTSGQAGKCFNVTHQAADSAPHLRKKMTSPISAPRDPRDRSRSTSAPPAAPPLASAQLGKSCKGDWGYQWCTEMVQPFTSGTEKDMFYPLASYNYSLSAADCKRQWGVTPTEWWAKVGLGGKRISASSNILFSNGALDPWSGGGVLTPPNPTMPVVIIPSGAHHIDLMFSDEADPPDVTQARATETATIQQWVQQAQRSRAFAAPPGSAAR